MKKRVAARAFSKGPVIIFLEGVEDFWEGGGKVAHIWDTKKLKYNQNYEE